MFWVIHRRLRNWKSSTWYNRRVKTWLGFIWPSSQKARWILAILLLLVIVWVVISNTSRPVKQTKRTDSASLLLREEQLKKLNQDTDKDGLKDWEEAIYRTDPAKADTDGDGTKDGDEIAMNRDPLIKGPKDQMATSTDEIANSPYLLPNNLTGLLAEKFGVNVIVPKLSGSPRPLDLEGIANQITDETLSNTTQQDYFTEKDIKISGDNSEKALENYGKAIIGAASVFSGITRSPLEIFAGALARDDFSTLNKLDPYLSAYDKYLALLTATSTPSGLASFHLRYMNLVASQKDAVRKIRGAEKDIVAAIIGAQEFAANFNGIQSLMEGLSYAPTK